MTSDEKAALVLADPSALWVVLNAGVKVAGPWERGGTNNGVSVRWTEDKSNDPAAIVEDIERCENAHENKRDAPYCPMCGNRTNVTMWMASSILAPPTIHPTRADAEAWTDARLREAGWLLVETPA